LITFFREDQTRSLRIRRSQDRGLKMSLSTKEQTKIRAAGVCQRKIANFDGKISIYN